MPVWDLNPKFASLYKPPQETFTGIKLVGVAGNAPAYSLFPEQVGSLFPYTPLNQSLLEELNLTLSIP